jgi:hypothetical protein
MTHIWFNLMMIHAGHMMYIDSFSTYEECHEAQIIYEEKFPEDKFFCPFVRVELT